MERLHVLKVRLVWVQDILSSYLMWILLKKIWTWIFQNQSLQNLQHSPIFPYLCNGDYSAKAIIWDFNLFNGLSQSLPKSSNKTQSRVLKETWFASENLQFDSAQQGSNKKITVEMFYTRRSRRWTLFRKWGLELSLCWSNHHCLRLQMNLVFPNAW